MCYHMPTVEIQEYRDQHRRSPFRAWFAGLSPEAARKVTSALYRMGIGNFSNVKGVGGGVLECKVNLARAIVFTSGKTGCNS
jgi:putative component of toxin-antitoxin plasmid stabilization module